MGLFSQKKPGLYLGSTEKKGVCAQIGFHDKIPGSSFSEESLPPPHSLSIPSKDQRMLQNHSILSQSLFSRVS